VTPEHRERVYRAAQKVAEVMGPEFVGSVTVHISRGGAGTVDVKEIIRSDTIRRREMSQ